MCIYITFIKKAIKYCNTTTKCIDEYYMIWLYIQNINGMNYVEQCAMMHHIDDAVKAVNAQWEVAQRTLTRYSYNLWMHNVWYKAWNKAEVRTVYFAVLSCKSFSCWSLNNTRSDVAHRPLPTDVLTPWWRHQMETFSALLAICSGNSPVTGEFPAQRPVTRSFRVFCDLRRINRWVNTREAGDLRRYRAHYDVIVMTQQTCIWSSLCQ